MHKWKCIELIDEPAKVQHRFPRKCIPHCSRARVSRSYSQQCITFNSKRKTLPSYADVYRTQFSLSKSKKGHPSITIQLNSNVRRVSESLEISFFPNLLRYESRCIIHTFKIPAQTHICAFSIRPIRSFHQINLIRIHPVYVAIFQIFRNTLRAQSACVR